MSDRVIVVGAGPVGLTCAALLARAGIPVLLVRSNLGARERPARLHLAPTYPRHDR